MSQIYDEYFSKKTLLGGLTVAGSIGILAFAATRYKIAPPGSVIVKTGLGVNSPSGIRVFPSTVQWPFQAVKEVSIQPSKFECRVAAMSAERIPVLLPFVATIAPKIPKAVNNNDWSILTDYARLMSQKKSDEIETLVKSILAGESRILAASMGINDLFSNRSKLKTELAEEVNKILSELGIEMLNLNIEELQDSDGSSYFHQQSQKALADVVKQAKIAVAKANAEAAVGEKEQEQHSRMRIAELESTTKRREYERDQDIAKSKSEFDIAAAEYDKNAKLVKYQTEAEAQQRNLDLQKDIEIRRASQETERLRAAEYAAKVVQAEVLVRESQGLADGKKIEAENLAKLQIIAAAAAADAKRLDAEAVLFARQQEATGLLKLAEAEAAGKQAVLLAEANGLRQKVEAAGGPQNYLAQALIQGNLLADIAEQQAKAVQGMNPKINVWSQSKGEDAPGTQVISDLVKTLPPLMDSLKSQTGIDLPALVRSKLGQ